MADGDGLRGLADVQLRGRGRRYSLYSVPLLGDAGHRAPASGGRDRQLFVTPLR